MTMSSLLLLVASLFSLFSFPLFPSHSSDMRYVVPFDYSLPSQCVAWLPTRLTSHRLTRVSPVHALPPSLSQEHSLALYNRALYSSNRYSGTKTVTAFRVLPPYWQNSSRNSSAVITSTGMPTPLPSACSSMWARMYCGIHGVINIQQTSA